MPNRPELPTFYSHRGTVYNVIPDDKPMTWCIWDLDGCIGEMHLADGMWTSHMLDADADAVFGPVNTWQEAVSGLLINRPDEVA